MSGRALSGRVSRRRDGTVITPEWILELVEYKPNRRMIAPPPMQLIKRMESRRARRERENGPGWTKQEWEALKDKYGNKCLCCGSTERLVPDHIEALVCGGVHHISNIQPLCHKCNFDKGLRTIDYRV